MTKTLNQIIIFFLHQNQNIFFSNIGNQNIFLEKNHNPPPPQVKWSFPNDAVYNTGLLYSIESVICRSHLSSAINAIYIISTCYGIHGNIAYLCPRVHFLEGMEEILYPLCRDLRSGDHLV